MAEDDEVWWDTDVDELSLGDDTTAGPVDKDHASGDVDASLTPADITTTTATVGTTGVATPGAPGLEGHTTIPDAAATPADATAPVTEPAPAAESPPASEVVSVPEPVADPEPVPVAVAIAVEATAVPAGNGADDITGMSSHHAGIGSTVQHAPPDTEAQLAQPGPSLHEGASNGPGVGPLGVAMDIGLDGAPGVGPIGVGPMGVGPMGVGPMGIPMDDPTADDPTQRDASDADQDNFFSSTSGAIEDAFGGLADVFEDLF